jgi:hypothetical protein
MSGGCGLATLFFINFEIKQPGNIYLRTVMLCANK